MMNQAFQRTMRRVWEALAACWGSRWAALYGCWGMLACIVALLHWQTPVPLLGVAGVALIAAWCVAPALQWGFATLLHTPATSPRMQAAQYGARVLTTPLLARIMRVFFAGLGVVVTLLCVSALVQIHPLMLVFAPVPVLWRYGAFR